MGYAGYTPTEARNIAKSIDAAAHREEYGYYLDDMAEARALHNPTVSFAEWRGNEQPKDMAMDRLMQIPNDEMDLH